MTLQAQWVHPKLSFFIFVLMTLLKLPVIARHEAILHNQVDELAGDCFMPRNDELNSATIWDAPVQRFLTQLMA